MGTKILTTYAFTKNSEIEKRQRKYEFGKFDNK